MIPTRRPGGPVLALAAVTAALLGLPLSGFEPGLPPTLEADEPAYYLAAESLVHDFDLRLDLADRRRLFESFPYFPARNLIVMSDDGWRTLYYGKPYLYSFFAAPFVAVGGFGGMLAFNMVLYVAMIWMGFVWLRRQRAEDGAAAAGGTGPTDSSEAWTALFVLGFFLASSSFVYVFWLHPEVFNMFAGFGCLYWGLGAAGDRHGSGRPVGRWAWPLVASAAVLAAGVYNKPMLAALGLPVCFALLRRRRWAGLTVWLVAAALSIGLYAGISTAFTGHPTAYLVDLRAGLPLHDPYPRLVEPIPVPEPDPVADASWSETVEERSKRGAGWWWILRLPDIRGFELAEDLPYFFFGRHTGLFVYHPFALLALGLFAVYGRRRPEAWAVLGSVALVAAFFLVLIPFNWHGGGGFVGNRYFVMAVPALLFCVPRVGPPVLVAAAFGLGGLTVGPLFLSPHGLVVPQGTLQAHVRNLPFRWLPLEHSLGEVPGYHGQVQGDLWLWGRKDHLRPVGDELWVAPAGSGGSPEVWIQSDRPLERLELELRSPLDANPARVALGSDLRRPDLSAAPARLVFEPGEIYGAAEADVRRRERRRDDYDRFLDLWLYRLVIEADRGELPRWSGRAGPYFDHAVSLRVLAAEPGPPPADTDVSE